MKKKDFYELWQQCKQLKTMEMSEAWHDSFDEGYIHQFQPEHLSNDHKDRPNQHENSHKQCNEMGHPIMNMMESQWKLRQQHDQNLTMEGRPL